MAITDKALAGRVTLVTGESQGIGRACALALGSRGANVVVAFPTQAHRSTPARAQRRGAATSQRPWADNPPRAGIPPRVVAIVATRQHRNPGARGDRPVEHHIGQVPARVARHHDVVSTERGRLERLLQVRDPPCQSRPFCFERLGQFAR